MPSVALNVWIYFLPRLRDILFVSILLAVMLLGPQMLNMDGDLPRHLLTGKFILETKTIPRTEPFSYPYQDKPYVPHEWLADVIFYLTYKFAGLAGIVILSASLLATTFYLLLAYSSSQFNLQLTSLFLVVWGAAVTSLNWVTRPHLISMLLLAVWLILLERLASDRKVSLWIFPFLMVIWSNLHGEFVAGMLAMLAYSAGWIWDYLFSKDLTKKSTGKKLIFATGLSFLASLINPAGFGPWKTMIGFVNNTYLMSRMYEARPPDFSQPEFMVLLGLLAFSILLLAMNKDRLPTSQALLLAGFSAMSLMAGRNVHLYGIVAPFVLVGTINQDHKFEFLLRLENSVRHVEQNLRGFFWPIMSFTTCLLIVSSGIFQNFYQFDPKTFPVQATKWITSNPQSGKMFNELNWGGYLAFSLWPDHSVFIDSMTDTTGELTRAYESVITLSPTRDDIFLRYEVNWIIVQTSSPLANQMKAEGWVMLYEDDTAVILRNASKK